MVVAAQRRREAGTADPLGVEWAVDGLAIGSRPQLGAVKQREVHARLVRSPPRRPSGSPCHDGSRCARPQTVTPSTSSTGSSCGD